MIECTVNLNGDQVARITMQETDAYKSRGLAAYQVDITIDKGASVGTHRRMVYDWPREGFNPVLLIRAALNLIDPTMAVIDGDTNGHSPDLARQIGGAVPEVQAREGELHHNRPTLWGEQPVKHGRHSHWEGAREEDRARCDPHRGYCELQRGYGCASPQDCPGF